MATDAPLGSPSFKLVAKGLIELHRLIQQGQDESPQADLIRDALDDPLRALSENERIRAQWLSDDLYSVSKAEVAEPRPMSAEAQRELNEATEARRNGQWDRALGLLRAWQDFVLPAQLSYLRGAIWLGAGQPEVAAVFYAHAADSDPENANYRVLHLHTLEKCDPVSARGIAQSVLNRHERESPVVVTKAAEILINETRAATDANAIEVRQMLIPILERNLSRLEAQQLAAGTPAIAMTAGLLGFCHEFLGDTAAAVGCYSRGIQDSQHNDALLTARAIQQYGHSPLAISDFEHAVQLGSKLVWPYLFLAHHYLATGRFSECIVMCEEGLRRLASDAVRSQLEQWRAIAQAELGFPGDLVKAGLEAALRADPSNDEAHRNLDAFQRAAAVGQPQGRVAWEKKSQDALRRLGIAERRATQWPAYRMAA